MLFDEADGLVGEAMVSLLTQLRLGYISREELSFPASVVLVGQRQVRDYALREQGRRGGAIRGSISWHLIEAEGLERPTLPMTNAAPDTRLKLQPTARWYRVGWDFEIEGLEPAVAEGLWPTASERVKEEVVETLLHRHLAELIGLEMSLLSRAPPLTQTEDLIAFDALDRLHLFELKAAPISEKVVEQLSHYLLSHIFEDRRSFTDQLVLSWDHQLPERLAVYLAGAYANERTGVWGFVYAKKALGDAFDAAVQENKWPQNQNQWDRLGSQASEIAEMRVATLLLHASTRFPNRPRIAPEKVWKMAEGLARSLPRERPPAPVRNRRPVVLWLVGTAVSKDALNRILGWRSRGVDARCLKLDIRPSKDNEGWILLTNREDAPARDALENGLCELFAKNLPWHRPTLELSLYDTSSASTRTGGGAALTRPRASVTQHDGTRTLFEAVHHNGRWEVVGTNA